MPLIDGGETDQEHEPRPACCRRAVANTPEAAADCCPHHERHADPSSFITTCSSGRQTTRTGGQGERTCTLLFWRKATSAPDFRHDLRRFDDFDPWSRWRIRDGGIAPSDSALPAALRHGAALGGALAAAGSGAVHRGRRDHADIRSRCGGAERRIRHGCSGPDPVRGVCGDLSPLARTPLVARLATQACSASSSPTHSADNCLERPDGLIIGAIFTLLLMMASGLSRSLRSVEMRVPHGYFADVESWRIGPRTPRQEGPHGSDCQLRAGDRSGRSAARSRGTTASAGRSCSSTSICSITAASSPLPWR